MQKFLLLALFGVVVLSGCKSTSSVYESNDLITVAHNQHNEYTLLTYQSPDGRVRKVLRRNGVFELAFVEKKDGSYVLKERGQEARKLSKESVAAVQARLDDLIYRDGAVAGKAPAAGGVF